MTEENQIDRIPEPFRSKYKNLIQRCKKANIECELYQYEDSDPELHIYMPCGRRKRDLAIYTPGAAEQLDTVDFENYTFIENYDAICSYCHGSVESLLESSHSTRWYLISKLLKQNVEKMPIEARRDLSWTTSKTISSQEIKLTLGKPSKVFLSLQGLATPEYLEDSPAEFDKMIAFKIEDLRINTHQEARTILQELGNGLFFEIDNILDEQVNLEPYLLGLEWTPPPWLLVQEHRKKRDSLPRTVSFPKYKYDVEPLNLYWYGAQLWQKPLMSFLAYYQFLEYYFYIFGEREAINDLRLILKSPAFDPDNNLDTDNVIMAVKRHLKGGFGDERSLLKTIVLALVEPKEMRDFLEPFKDYYLDKYKGISS